MSSRYAYLDAPLPLAFAHRGGAAEGDENTAEAFARAVSLGYRYLESDVRATRDGVPVLFHDPNLDRLAGRPGTVADLTWPDLATIRVGGAAAVPRLDEVLAAWPGVRFNLDVKVEPAVATTVATVAAARAGDRVLLASFSDARLARLRELAGPAVATSLGRRGVARLRLASLGGRLTSRRHGDPRHGRGQHGDRQAGDRQAGDRQAGDGRRRWPPESVIAAQVPVRSGRVPVVDARFVRHAHRLGLQVHVWTVDEPAQIHELLDLGVDGIMTDHVEVLRQVYLDRGCWHPGP